MRVTSFGRALRDDLAAVLARARAQVDEPVGRAHHLLVVLDDEHRVAEVAQPLERPDQAVVVALVESDRRLVEDVEHADELRADLRREPDALRLAARERARGAVERQVADADVVQERQPLADLLDDPARRSAPPSVGQLELLEELERAGDRQLRELVDAVPPTVTASTSGLSRAPLQTGQAAEGHVLLDALALLRRVGLRGSGARGS